jgi:hypothetical protein
MPADHATNLLSHRGPRSIWDRRGWRGVTVEERLGPSFVSLAGAGMLVYGATRRSWRGVLYMMSGVSLIGCAAAGLCSPREAPVRWRHLRGFAADPVTVESMDSFPASDAPSSNTTAAARTPQGEEAR